MSDPKTPAVHHAHDILRVERRPLDAIFAPKTVAVIGATEKAGSVGPDDPLEPDQQPVRRTVFPVNPKRPNVLGIKAYPSDRRGARAGRPGRGRDARARRSPTSSASASTPASRRRSSSRPGFKEIGADGRRARAAGARAGPARPDAASSARTAWA